MHTRGPFQKQFTTSKMETGRSSRNDNLSQFSYMYGYCGKKRSLLNIGPQILFLTHHSGFEPGFDPLYKLRPFVTKLNKFNGIYNPERDLSYDDATCGWKGQRLQPCQTDMFWNETTKFARWVRVSLGFDVYTGTPELFVQHIVMPWA